MSKLISTWRNSILSTQGFVLGATLFLWNINDLHEYVTHTFSPFMWFISQIISGKVDWTPKHLQEEPVKFGRKNVWQYFLNFELEMRLRNDRISVAFSSLLFKFRYTFYHHFD